MNKPVKSKSIEIRVTPEFKARIEKEAKKRQSSVAGFITDRLMEWFLGQD